MMIIRKARPDDAAAIAACLLLAMENIVYSFIGQNDAVKAKEFMLYFVKREANQYSYQNCRVTEKDGKVVAAVNVYDGAALMALRKPVLAYLRNQYQRILLPEDETAAGEYYIDTVGVNPAFQGKGIGGALLQHLIDEYVHQRGYTLGLLVEEENLQAKRLYGKLGFTHTGRKTLLGRDLEHLQCKKS